MNFSEFPEFAKELKSYSKKYRSLAHDFENFKILISAAGELEATGFFQGSQATRLIISSSYEVVKARLDCAALSSKQLLRVIYIQTATEVQFVELYAKNEKTREDTQRIKKYLP